MNKLFLQIICIIVFLINACTPSTTSAPTASTQIATSTPSPTRTFTVTPLPTIPTFTPTFNVSTIVTVTPAPKAECPKENHLFSPTITYNSNYPIFNTQEILGFLNKGIPISVLLDEINNPGFDPLLISKDVTGDTTPELLFINLEPIGHFYVYVCSQEKYDLFSPDINYFGYDTAVIDVKDLNADGIQEIILQHHGCTGNGCYSIYILEWDGNQFQVINTDPNYGESMDGLINIEIRDLNKDGISEILLTGGIPALGGYIINPPWRLETKTLTWNGKVFSLEKINFEPPQFRFQAIQDGDNATLSGNFVDAIKAYQDAIFNNNLNWWSSQRQTDTIIKLGNEGYSALGTPAPGDPDTTEYPRLAAYAYYRIMLLHLIQNHESDATTTYNTLQQEFGNDPYARPYVEMASAFWDTYQSTQKMYDGCAAAIQYAVEHPEILTPLGSDYHGSQSHIYVPEDVCPFR